MNIKKIYKFDRNCWIIGNQDFFCLGIILRTFKKDTLTFCDNSHFIKLCIDDPHVTAMIVAQRDLDEYQDKYGTIQDKGVVIVENPRNFFFRFHNYLALETAFYNKEHVISHIGKNSKIATTAIIAKNNVVIGENVRIDDNVIIYDSVEIGDYSIVRAGSIIGGDSLQFIKTPEGNMYIEHVGGVRIGSHVEIQYNCIIAKHVFNDVTEIGDNTKLADMVHFAHGSKIGQNCLIAPLSLVGGGTIIEDNVWIGPGSTVSTGLLIGANSSISLGSVVTKDVKENERVSGNFAIHHDAFIDFMKTIRKKVPPNITNS